MARLDSPWVTAAFGLIVALLTWDYVQITPAPGLDASWILGLNLAAAQGLDHGTEIIFTYGPLGFLEQPMVVDGLLATLGGVYLLAIRALFAATLLLAARRSFSWPAAALLALALAAIVPRAVGSVPLALTMLWCLIALQRDAPSWTRPLLLYGGGALAALEVLVKLNVGLTIALAIAIAVVALPGPRLGGLARFAGTFVAAFAVLWFASGQGVGNVDDYVRSAYEVISGYQRTMQIEDGAVPWDWAAALIVSAATLGMVLWRGMRESAPARLAMVAIVALLIFSLEKYGFVRHDAGHVGAIFGVLASAWVAFRWEPPLKLVAPAAVALIAIVYFPAADESLERTIAPRTAIEQLSDLVLPRERAAARDEARASLARGYALDPAMLEAIDGRTVDARPWEIGLIWAYGLERNWRPLPVLQDYTAYTPYLDQVNARALAADDGPELILRHLGYDSSSLVGIDGRLTTFDSPAALRTMLCTYRPAQTTEAYQLLERSSDRCGPERPLGTVEAAYGEPVTVPDAGPGEAVFARVDGAGGQGVERLRTFAYREALRTVALDRTATRFQTPTAPDGILISAPPDADFPDPFALALNPETITIDSSGGFATSDGPLEIEFFALPVADVGT